MNPSSKIPPSPEAETRLNRRGFLKLSGSGAMLASASLLGVAGRAYPIESPKTIRMGVVGGGFGANFYWHEHPNCVVTGVSDLRPNRRKVLQKKYQCDAVYDSLEEMVKKAKDIDAVAIFSGAPDHFKHVKMCMQRGWHVACAVPACMTLEEAAELKEIKERTGRRYMMAESSYYRQPCIYARNLYKTGGFGQIFYSEVEYYHGRGDVNRFHLNKNTRFYEPDGSRSWRWGFPPMHYPTHSLGYLVGVTGERIRKVSCLGWGTDHVFLKENVYNNPFWNQSALMQTDQGHMCRCNVFWHCKAGGERAQWFGEKVSLYMTNEGVHGQIQQPGGRVKIPNYWETDMLPQAMRHASGHGGSAVFLSAEFVNALLEDREPTCGIYNALAMTVPGIVAHQSSLKGGEQLNVPQFDPPKG